MKGKILFALIILLVTLFAFTVTPAGAKNACTVIASGTLMTPSGKPVVLGFDEGGYNYQAHLFIGQYSTYRIKMKWNDAYLSNKDCDGNNILDKHYGFASYVGSGAWITLHYNGEYEQDGEVCKWSKFVKIVAIPEGAYQVLGIYYTADGKEIGPGTWQDFATVQEVINDPCDGLHGKQFRDPDHAGLGGW